MSNSRLDKDNSLRKSATERSLAKPTAEQKLRRARTLGLFFERVKQNQNEKLFQELISATTQLAIIQKEIQEMQERTLPAEMKERIALLGDLLRGRKRQSSLSDFEENDIANDEQSQQRKQP